MTPNQFVYHAWLAYRLLPHGERPTRKHVWIARLLARWQHPCPSHAKLARAAGCCEKTVRNALKRFRALGMLTWKHQGALMRSGQRRQLPNRYFFVASFLLSSPPAKEESVVVRSPNRSVGKLAPEALQALKVKWGLVASPVRA